MDFFSVLLYAVLASAAAVPEPAALPLAQAQPGSPVQRAEATSGPIVLEGLSSDTNIVVSVALVTAAPAANAMRVNAAGASDDQPSSSCKPSSICFDGITCGLRYGGCFDQNFCGGSTSFPMPTCTDDPSAGLTQRMQRRAQELAAARAAEE